MKFRVYLSVKSKLENFSSGSQTLYFDTAIGMRTALQSLYAHAEHTGIYVSIERIEANYCGELGAWLANPVLEPIAK